MIKYKNKFVDNICFKYLLNKLTWCMSYLS